VILLFRKKKKKKYIRYFFIYLIVLSLISALTYFLFFNPTQINSGIVLDKKESSNSISLKLGYKKNIKWVKVSKKISLPDSLAYNVTMKGFRLKSITPCEVYTGRVFSRDDKNVVFQDGKTLKLNKDVTFVKKEGESLTLLAPNSVISGGSDYKFIGDDSGNISTILVGSIDVNAIRVGISNRDFTTLDHQQIGLYSSMGLSVKFNNTEYKTKKSRSQWPVKIHEELVLENKNGTTVLSVYTLSINIYTGEAIPVFKAKIGETKDKIYITPGSEDSPIYAYTLKRTNGYVPSYYGTFEVFMKDSALRMINEVDIEKYLKYVVPSEMLSSGGLEGYKVQAIAARTYVLSDMLSGRFTASGFHVDDTVMTQAYNAQAPNDICDRAIEESRGMVLAYNNKIIDAKYYSTSAGVGAPFNQIYYSKDEYNGDNPEPYLGFMDFTGTGVKDLSDEARAAEFFKDWTVNSYDSNSPYFRWKISIDAKDLIKTINSTIYDRYTNSPDSFKKKWYLGIYRKTAIPKEGIGNIQDLFISKRGTAGNIMELTLVSDTGTYRVEKEINIKKLLTPPEFIMTPLYGKDTKSFKKLPSPFFVIESQLQKGKLKGIIIYGGGYGHGVGMSQYGVIGLAKAGRSYNEILNIFYKDIKITDYEDILKASI
jgi:SpoIID/LytB domain protein